MSSQIARKVVQYFHHLGPSSNETENLSPRELEILEMVVKGLTNKQIARVLNISTHTARNHVNSIIEKLDAADRTEAATTAIQRGIIGMDQ